MLRTARVVALRRVAFRGVALAGLAAGLLLFFAQGRAAVADEPAGGALARELPRLFDIGWDSSISAQRAADAQFEQLQKLAPGDRRVDYAYALVLIRQRRYPQALEHVNRLVELDEKSGTTELPAWRASVWLAMLTKDYTAALVTMDRVSQRIGEGDEVPRSDMARFLGRMFAFLEGPAEGAVADIRLLKHRRTIFDRLESPQQLAFEDGYHRLLDLFSANADETDRTKEDAARNEIERRELAKEDLEKERERITAGLADNQAQRDRLREEYDSAVSKLDAEEAPLVDQINDLNRRAAVVQSERSLTGSDYVRLQGLLARERDPFIRDQIRRDLARLDLLLSRYDADLAVLERQAAAINGKRLDIAARRQATQAAYAGEIKRLDDQRSDLYKAGRRVGIEEKRNTTPVTGNSPKVRALSAQAKALTTYEEFPLEEERQRILASLK